VKTWIITSGAAFSPFLYFAFVAVWQASFA